MFKHTGKGRNYSHNLKIAILLSSVAGMVNIAGVLSIGTLTTNVTGHFAFFAEVLFLENYTKAVIYILYVLAFLLGAFFSGMLSEIIRKRQYKYTLSYSVPMSVEILILLWWAIAYGFVYKGPITSALGFSLSLLFAMGLQNALVSRISKSVVRTTHLTGLFTDLGIELSQLFFVKEGERKSLSHSIFLKLAIISCFFIGGLCGALFYGSLQLKILFFPAALLLFALWYDQFLFRYYHIKRKFRH
ncbi:YoaK family protein [Sphingobacterium sp. LRF_L2]|uniref:YoaK family protein n=1 Tax=Sphingobacterium sp. LRF_L2 TaxID=3369421 RepID=UPI003F62E835